MSEVVAQSYKELLGHIEKDVTELKDGRIEVFRKLDEKVDKKEFATFDEKLDSHFDEMRKERKGDMKWAFGLGVSGVVAICSFFWGLTSVTNKKIEQYRDESIDFKVRVLEQSSNLDKRTSVIEAQLKGLKLID